MAIEAKKTTEINYEEELAGGRVKSDLIPAEMVDSFTEAVRDSGLGFTTVEAGGSFFVMTTAHWEGGRPEGDPYIKRVTVGEGQVGVYTEVPQVPQRAIR